MSAGSYAFIACTLRMACCTYSHHVSGDCSAHPGCLDTIAASLSGYCALASTASVAASTTDTLIEEVPRSIPNNNMANKILSLPQPIHPTSQLVHPPHRDAQPPTPLEA